MTKYLNKKGIIMDLTELFCDVDNFVKLHKIAIKFTYSGNINNYSILMAFIFFRKT